MGVFEQRRRAYGYRTLHGFEEREEVGYERVGQLRTQEVAQYVVVRGVAECNLIEVVLLHELVEHVGAEHHGARYLHLRSIQRVELGVHLYDVVEERQASALSAERAFADACEVGVGVELHAVEHRHHADILHVAILHYGVEDNLAVGCDVLQPLPRHGLQEHRHGEDGTRREPAAHVVARDVVEHRVVWNLEDVVLQFLQRVYAHYLGFRLRVAEDKVAKAEVLLKNLSQVERHLLRVLVDEAESFSLSLGAVLRLRAFEYERQIWIVLPYLAHQFQTRLAVLLAVYGEAHIAYHAEHIVRVAFVQRHSLLVVARQHHLRSAAHTQRCRVAVERLGSEALALRQYVVVEVGQYRTVEAYAVLNEQNHLHAALVDVVLEVHLVLYQLDDREDKIGVAEPAEHVVEDGEVFVLHTFRDAVRERREHYAVHVRKLRLYVARHAERVVVGVARHADYEVDVHRAQHLARLLRSAHLCERRRIAQTELHILVVYLLLNASVVLEHERVVRVCHDEHIVYATHHQIDERHVFQVELLIFLWYHILLLLSVCSLCPVGLFSLALFHDYFFTPMFHSVKLMASAVSSSRFASGLPPPCPAFTPMLMSTGAVPP